MSIYFPTEYEKIIERVQAINPVRYGRTRNYTDGYVTYISPYLTHGVISLPYVRDVVLQKYSVKESYTFIFELAWREFFQRVYVEEQDRIFKDLKSPQVGVKRYGVPKSLVDATTSILAIDTASASLYTTGYMHNHARMWHAMLATNVGHYAWWDVSRHMFYHLLDGDKASNTLSWQWVAGTFSSKQYFANQDMINKFSPAKQKNSYLDVDISLLATICPKELEESVPFTLVTDFELFASVHTLDSLSGDRYALYSIWTLDATWNPVSTPTTKVLFIDKDELTTFPISPARIEFIRALSKNIVDIHVVVGTRNELTKWSADKCVYRKSHPALETWPGVVSSPEYLFPDITQLPRGFMSFWKKCERYLYV